MSAFPILSLLQNRDGDYSLEQEGGLTKRELFAAMAMQGLLSNPSGPYQSSDMCGWRLVNCTHHQLAMECIDMACALLEELEKTND